MQGLQPTSGPPAVSRSLPGSDRTSSIIPLFHAAWLFALGIAVAHAVWLRPSLVLIAILPVALVCLVATWRAERVRWVPLAVLWCLLGAWCAEMEPQPAPSPTISALSDGLLRLVEGILTDPASVREERVENVEETANDDPSQRIDLKVMSIESVFDVEDKQTPAYGAARLTIRWPQRSDPISLESFRCGEKIRAVVRLLPPEEYRDPGAWSRRNYLLDQGITATASTSIERVERIDALATPSLRCRLLSPQRACAARLLALPKSMRGLPALLRLSEDDAVMLAAMTTGDRTFLTHSLRAGFERTGSFHMLVVSGFHLAIVARCIFWLARRLRLPRVPATLITIVASFAYALFTGFATPVQRSLWMVTLYLLGRLGSSCPIRFALGGWRPRFRPDQATSRSAHAFCRFVRSQRQAGCSHPPRLRRWLHALPGPHPSPRMSRRTRSPKGDPA